MAKKQMSRRSFITSSVTGIAAASIIGVTKNTMALPQEQKASQESSKKIIYRKLGKTDIEIPIVNMGVMNTLDPELVRKSYELGVRHFDTSSAYMRGKNEEMVGGVIKEMNIRDKVIIGTKIYIPHQQRPTLSENEAKAEALKIANESLARLQTDYVDILYLHNVSDLNWLNNKGIIEALQQMKEQKKTRYIGFTTHLNMPLLINDAIKNGIYEVIETAYNYSFSDWDEYKTVLKDAASRGIGLIAMKTQCKQPWYMQNSTESIQKFYKGEILHTALLKWVLRHDFITCAIPGYTSFKELEEDLSVMYDLEYTPGEQKFLESRNVQLALSGVCRQCAECLPSCPKGVDIPELIRTHMYAASYSNFHEARDTISQIPKEKGIQTCASCNTCKAKCVRNVNIPRRIDELKLIYA
jgi:predicted aldo/keto reductase-like oxidoreductase